MAKMYFLKKQILFYSIITNIAVIITHSFKATGNTSQLIAALVTISYHYFHFLSSLSVSITTFFSKIQIFIR